MTPVAIALLLTWCAGLCWFDLRVRRLPNALTGIGALVVLLHAAYTGRLRVAAVGGALLCLSYLLVHLAVPAALGAGDVKLAFGLGAIAAMDGARAWVAAALAAPLLTAAAGIALLTARRAERQVPHGPSMCLATLLAVLAIPP
ncbi:prepilin peptidase [Nocardia takedensis]